MVVDGILLETEGGIYLSTDEGASWARDTPINILPSLQLPGMKALIKEASNTLIFSTNNGALWSPDTVGIGQETLLSIENVGTDVFLGTLNDGIFLSTNIGTGWKPVNEGLADSTFAILHAHRGELFAVSPSPDFWHTNFWRRPLSDFGISSVAQTPAIPSEIQSYPNPFSQRATITFTSEASGYADVRVVNLLGAEVAHLYSGELSPGEHSFAWDATGFAPGIYECVVRMNGSVRQIPMVLSR